jgi:hypothetical protein
MKTLARAIASELLKLKRTLALWMVFVAPLVVVTLEFLLILQHISKRRIPDGWQLVTGGTYGFYAVGMLPLFITLETALLAGLEHNAKAWKQIFALAVPRSAIYTAKMLVATALIGASCIVLFAGTIASGYALSALLPNANFTSGPQWEELVSGAASMFLASWLIIALHSWVALRWQSFAFASGFGMSATVGVALISNSERFWKFYPWSLPVHASLPNSNTLLALTLGAFGGLVVAIAGSWDLARRDVI